ncbi:MAG: TonB-dependent receptor domain-containing protein [Terriglobales bacterium]
MRRLATCCAVLCLLGTACASHPNTATLAGRVVDQDGRAIVGAEVQAECSFTGQPVSATTDANGRFSLARLRAGACDLTVTAKGFETRKEDIQLRAGQQLETVLQLRVATVTEVVNVIRERELMQDELSVNDVRESSAKDVGEALARVDGVWKVRKGGIANDIVLRGFQHGNLDVLIDGARIYGACPGHMDPVAYHVDFAEIEQVGITKGPFDVKNQGGLGGTINIINKGPVADLTVRPTFSAGSFGFYNPSVTASAGTDSFKALGGYSYRTSGPYKDGSGRRVTSYTNYTASALERRGFDVHTGWFDTDFAPTAKQRVSIGYTRQQGGLVLYPYLLMDANYDNADRVNVKYEIRDLASRISAVRVQSYYTQVKHFMTDEQRTSSLGALTTYSMATNASTRAAGGHVEVQMGRKLNVGFEMFHRNWSAMNYMRKMGMNTDQNIIPDVATLAIGAYLDYKHNLGEKVLLSGGVRIDHSGMETASAAPTSLYYAYKGTRRLSAADTQPSANMRLTIAGPKSVQFFLGAGSAVRFPDAQERFFQQKKMGQDVVGNPLLNPTRNTEGTVGFNFKRGSSFVKTELFYSALTDYITVHNQARLNMVPGIMNMQARSFENVDARIYGGESSYALALPHQVLLSGGVSYSRGIKNRNIAANLLSTNLPEMPPLRGWTSLRYTHRLFFTEVSGIAVNRQGRVDTGLKETPTAGYGLMNLQLGVHPGKLYVVLFVDNVLNRYYFEHFSAQRDPFRAGVKVPEPGRNIFATIAYSF